MATIHPMHCARNAMLRVVGDDLHLPAVISERHCRWRLQLFALSGILIFCSPGHFFTLWICIPYIAIDTTFFFLSSKRGLLLREGFHSEIQNRKIRNKETMIPAFWASVKKENFSKAEYRGPGVWRCPLTVPWCSLTQALGRAVCHAFPHVVLCSQRMWVCNRQKSGHWCCCVWLIQRGEVMDMGGGGTEKKTFDLLFFYFIL